MALSLAALTACFTQDLELARQQVIRAQARTGAIEELVWLVPLLTYLGDYDRCEHLLMERGLLEHAWGRQALFRIWRKRREHNPWRALIPAALWPQWVQQMDGALKTPPKPLRVDLVGGLGDALENLAVIEASSVATSLQSGLTYTPGPDGPSEHALRPLLDPWRVEELPANGFTSPALRCGLASLGWERCPQVLWPGDSQPRANQWVVCWRCKPDWRNPLSSFSRSIPWPVLQGFLQELQPLLAAAGVRLLDLTAYSPWEQSWMAQCMPSVQLVGKRIQNLADTQAVLRSCRGAISVDTSLVHLAALSAEPVTVLLPLFADERWVELLQATGAYAQWVTPLRQQDFNCWRWPLQQLLIRFEAMA